jgi:hypothetical protein
MEPEGSIPCSQEPSTGPYSEPYQSNPLHPKVLDSRNISYSISMQVFIILFPVILLFVKNGNNYSTYKFHCGGRDYNYGKYSQKT